MINTAKISIINVLLLLPFIFVILSCRKDNTMVNAVNPNETVGRGGISYLALGDSYTIGQNVDEEERFPAQTADLLNRAGIGVSTLDYIATTGWTTIDLSSAIETGQPSNNYDLVSLLIGVNDQYRGLDTAGYRVRFRALLQNAIQLAGNRKERVFVVSIPDYSATPFVPTYRKAEVSKEINHFNRINKEITLSAGVTYLDITPGSRDAQNDATLVADDGLHPSGKEYSKWASQLAPLMASVLK